MKMIVVVALALVAAAAAAPAAVEEPVSILRSEFEKQPDGGYNFNYESADGSKREETGEVKEVFDEEKKPHDVVVVRGSYTYTDKEGKTETINYEADENGYRAFGDSIPKFPARR